MGVDIQNIQIQEMPPLKKVAVIHFFKLGLFYLTGNRPLAHDINTVPLEDNFKVLMFKRANN